ncbi:ATP-binding protein [Hymenobacter sp. YC55]|uniref:PAS domain-containing sensor histidine kinase n=1 Tax=Hymenobacter sp. YC55 TaxID=3034019 RepID=UPI0023F62A51|nr:ATP-binding protein [Hymenobacter sp. YC55]MDF7811389.1 PAS domain-containing protein [Hymenobacter sp. YC55]
MVLSKPDFLDFLAVFNAMPGAYLLLSPELIIEAVTETYLIETLTRRENLLGRNIFDAFPDNPDAPQANAVRNLRASLEQVRATGQPHVMELQHYDVPDLVHAGKFTERYWLPRNTPVLDAQGQVRHIIHEVVNVTQSYQTDVLLRDSQANERTARADAQAEILARQLVERSEARLRIANQELEARVVERTREVQIAQAEAERQRARLERLFMQAPAAICILGGDDFVFELVNPTYQQLFPGRELLGKPILTALPEIAEHTVFRTIYQVYNTGETHQELGTLVPLARSADGVLENRYFNYIQQARYNEQGRIDGVIVFAFEVTQQVEAWQLLRATFDSSADMIQAFEAVRNEQGAIVDFRWTLVNSVTQTYYGTDVVGKQLLEHNPGVQAAGIFERFVEVVKTGEPQRYEQEYRFEQFNGWFEQSVVRLRDGLVTTTANITTRKQAEQQVLATNEQLRRINVDLDNFIYTASHDLRAPITNIEGLVHAIHTALPDDLECAQTIAPLLAMMQESVERFKRTIDYLSDVIKLQKEHEQSPTPLELATVVEDVRQDLLPLIQATTAHLDVAVDSCFTVKFSAKNLRSVVYNLLSNALKYRSPDRTPHVQIRCGQEGAFTVLTVQDNGLGIKSSQQQDLFTMFRRFHDHVEGNGIGLYMVKRIVENAGGRIEVASELGQGSTFSVYFRR